MKTGKEIMERAAVYYEMGQRYKKMASEQNIVYLKEYFEKVAKLNSEIAENLRWCVS